MRIAMNGDPFALAQPVAAESGSRGDRSQCAQVKLISQSSRKNDRLDAQMLARLARWTRSCCGRFGTVASRRKGT